MAEFDHDKYHPNYESNCHLCKTRHSYNIRKTLHDEAHKFYDQFCIDCNERKDLDFINKLFRTEVVPVSTPITYTPGEKLPFATISKDVKLQLIKKKMYRIDFEGIDGSGKTTALKKYIYHLRDVGYRVLESREVGNPHIPICVELRKLILNPDVKMDKRSMELIFSAMRIENDRFYESVQYDYDVLVSDRGWLSHLAYCDVNCYPEFTNKFYFNFLESECTLPNMIIYMDIDPDLATSRRNTRNEVKDSIEAKGDIFLNNVSDAFKTHLKLLKNRVVFIDANKSLEDVEIQLKKIPFSF